MKREPRLRGRTLGFLVFSGLSSAGTGLVFPLVAIYMADVRGLSLAFVSAYFALAAASGIVIALGAGWAADKIGPKWVVAAGMASEGTGVCLFSTADSGASFAAAAILIGTGNGAFFATISPMLASLEQGRALDRSFAFSYWVINAGSALGLSAGAVALTVANEEAYGPLFLANGLSSILFAVMTVVLARGESPQSAVSHLQFGVLMRDRRLSWILVGNTLTKAFGFGLFESVIPLALVHQVAESGQAANLMVLASAVVIVLLQLLVPRMLQTWDQIPLLLLQCYTWVSASVVATILLVVVELPVLTAIFYGAVRIIQNPR